MKRTCTMMSCALAALLLAFIPLSTVAEPGYQISLSGRTTVHQGQSLILTASGVNPTNGYDVYFLTVIAFDPSVVSACPGGTNEAQQLAEQTNSGNILARTLREQQDTSGHWSIVVGGKATKPGRTLICGYTHDGLDSVMAKTSFSVNVLRSAAKK